MKIRASFAQDKPTGHKIMCPVFVYITISGISALTLWETGATIIVSAICKKGNQEDKGERLCFR